MLLIFFFFNDTATTEIYTLSLHDALPISPIFVFSKHMNRRVLTEQDVKRLLPGSPCYVEAGTILTALADRKSTRLNSSHTVISYAVFCLKKKKKKNKKNIYK